MQNILTPSKVNFVYKNPTYDAPRNHSPFRHNLKTQPNHPSPIKFHNVSPIKQPIVTNRQAVISPRCIQQQNLYFRAINTLRKNQPLCFTKMENYKKVISPKQVQMGPIEIMPPAPQKSTEQSNRFQQEIKNSSDLEIMCLNNDNKKAKYKMEESPNKVYCSKCSIVLVSKGVKMVELKSEKSEMERKNKQMQQFLIKICAIRTKLQAEFANLQKDKVELTTKTKGDRQLIIKSYDQIYKLLKQYQIKDLSQITLHEQTCLEKITYFQSAFKQALDRIALMEMDITPNIDIILTRIDDVKYNQFMSDYQIQLKMIKNHINNYMQLSYPAKPQIVVKEWTRFNYQSVSLINLNNNSLCFSFENSKESQKAEEKPFRTLFEEETVEQNGAASPNFKSI